jgi:hypothetical protein
MFFSGLILRGLCVLPAAFTLPHDKERQPEMNTLSTYYTLTVYKPSDDKLNALKVESSGGGFGIYQASSPSYCPSVVNPCPNGTELAFLSTLYPVS